jgi:hypothetical protein
LERLLVVTVTETWIVGRERALTGLERAVAESGGTTVSAAARPTRIRGIWRRRAARA